MQVYIGYKFRNTKDKVKLKEGLTKISKKIESLGHKTFILERDVRKWKDKHYPIHSSLIPVIKNISKSDIVLAFVIDSCPSKGLLFETVAARLLNKKRILAVKKGIKTSIHRKAIKKVIEFETIDDLLADLEKEFS